MAEVSYLITGGLGNFTTGGGAGLTATEIANAVWDTTLANHLVAGSTGAALNSRASQASVDTLDNEVENVSVSVSTLESDVADILAKTIQMNFTTPGVVDASIPAGVQVTPVDIDGLSFVSAMEAILAVLMNVAVPAGATVSFKKRDGTTEKVNITYGALDGSRAVSTITS